MSGTVFRGLVPLSVRIGPVLPVTIEGFLVASELAGRVLLIRYLRRDRGQPATLTD